MALDRWIALTVLLIALVYGYAAFFTMDASLPPFMRRNPVWPSTFPKILAVLTVLVALVILSGVEKADHKPGEGDIDYRRLGDYRIGQALLFLGLMTLYAISLRTAGFLAATALFLIVGAAVLGERRWVVLIPVALVATGGVWYLVQQVLGIFLRPLPFFMGA